MIVLILCVLLNLTVYIVSDSKKEEAVIGKLRSPNALLINELSRCGDVQPTVWWSDFHLISGRLGIDLLLCVLFSLLEQSCHECIDLVCAIKSNYVSCFLFKKGELWLIKRVNALSINELSRRSIYSDKVNLTSFLADQEMICFHVYFPPF